MSASLAVWHASQRVGRLMLMPDRRMAFVYDGDWLERGWAISCSLPLTETGDFIPPDMRGHHYFANLLPEGGARDRLVRQLGIADDDFLLLEKLGGDCAGALQLLPEGDVPANPNDQLREIEKPQLLNAIRTGRGQWFEGEEPPRLSLAGAQDKLAIRARQAGDTWRFFLPVSGAASTHILKLPVPDLRHVPLYETYTTFLANRLDLPVASAWPVPLGKEVLSLSRRFDRLAENGNILRLHQEDLCQAQGLSRAVKYSNAPTIFPALAELLREHSIQPARDIQALVEWQVFNALVGNTDGHLKNLSLLAVPGGGWQLAPFYDLVCTLAIPRVSHRMALPIGGKDDPQNLSGNHWQGFAHELGVSARLVQRLIRSQAEQLVAQADMCLDEFRGLYGDYPALDRVQAVVKRQSNKALKNWL